MVKYKLKCKECGSEFEYRLFQISAVTKCERCGKEYIVTKNKLVMILEIVVLFALALGIREFIFETNRINNLFVELIIVLGMLLLVNFLFDVIFTKLIKWDKYYVLVERATPIPSNKRK